MSQRWSAQSLIDLVLDEGSFESWDPPVDISGHSESYQKELRAASERAGTDESVLTGRGLVRGRAVAVVVNEFAFLGGSIGGAAASRIVSAVRRATKEGLPLLATTASGGTRMQEGTPAFFELVTVIDTPGAELSREAEEGAIAGEIARCIATLTTMTVPTVSLILGQACGGGALALLPAQVVVATENAWLSPLPPEGASVIRFGDTEHAAEMAESQGIGSAALVESGIVHRVVPELPEDGAESLAVAVAATVANELAHLRE